MRKVEKRETRLIEAGRPELGAARPANPALDRASTLLFDDVLELERHEPATKNAPTYGRTGTQIHKACRDAFTELEGGYDSLLTPSGLSACILVLQAYAQPGVHFLIGDNVYGPTRAFCEQVLLPLGVNCEFFDPMMGEEIATLIKPQTKLIFFESPGSLSMEVANGPAIVKAAKAGGVTTAMDNSWAAGWLHQPLSYGADLSIQSATKYVMGGSDAIMGALIAGNAQAFERCWKMMRLSGLHVSPDTAYMAQRGLRSLAVRMKAHDSSAVFIATALSEHPKIGRVLHPAFSSCPGHENWKRDFSGANGSFSFSFAPELEHIVEPFLKKLRIFRAGYSFGGFESLITRVDGNIRRSAVPWKPCGSTFRLHIGLENRDDLLGELVEALGR